MIIPVALASHWRSRTRGTVNEVYLVVVLLLVSCPRTDHGIEDGYAEVMLFTR